MEVEYEITSDDLFAFQWRANFRSPLARRARRRADLYWFLAVLLFSLLPAISYDGFVISRANFVFLAVAFPVGVFLHRRWERRVVRRGILELIKEEKPDRGQLGWHKVALTEVGVVERSAVGESRASWAGVDRVEQNPDYIFIYTAHSGAHIIPKRVFGDAREARTFYQLASVSKQGTA